MKTLRTKLTRPQMTTLQAMPFELGPGRRVPFGVNHNSLDTLIRRGLAKRSATPGMGYRYEATEKARPYMAGQPRPDERIVLEVADKVGLVRVREIIAAASGDRFAQIEAFVRECATLKLDLDTADMTRAFHAVRRNARMLLDHPMED